MFQSKNHPSRSRTLPTLLTAILSVAVAFACSDSPMQVATDGTAPLLKPGKGGGKPGPKPSDPGTPLEITTVSGAFTADGGGSYAEPTDGVLTHLSGVNGNLLFDLRQSDMRRVHVAALGADFLAQTRIFTNNGPDADLGLKTEIGGSAVLESEWTDSGFFYSLRYGKDCSGNVHEVDKVGVSFDSGTSTWTLTGVNGVLCQRKQKGKPGLTEINSGAASFVMTLKK